MKKKEKKKESETELTASILKEDQNTQNIKQNALLFLLSNNTRQNANVLCCPIEKCSVQPFMCFDQL